MKKLLILLLGLIGLNTGCMAQDAIESVDAENFEQQIKDAKTQILDVRTAAEFATGHLENALNIDVKQSDFKGKAAKSLDKKKTIMIYCRSGKRSMTAAQLLSQEGYQVVNLTGGILSWQSKGKKVVK